MPRMNIETGRRRRPDSCTRSAFSKALKTQVSPKASPFGLAVQQTAALFGAQPTQRILRRLRRGRVAPSGHVLEMSRRFSRAHTFQNLDPAKRADPFRSRIGPIGLLFQFFQTFAH